MSTMDYWLQCIHQWFPNLHNETYFLPPLYFNRVPCSQQGVAGQSVIVLEQAFGAKHAVASPSTHHQFTPVLDAYIRDDTSQRRVLNCLHALAEKEKEVMVIISQLQFGNYLNKPSYAPAISALPRPMDFGSPHRQGDFDILILHSKLGMVTGEIKSVGDNFMQLNNTQDVQNGIIANVIQKAVTQLNKSEDLLKYLVSDLPNINITKVLILPNVTTRQVEIALNSHPEIEQTLCTCMDSSSIEEAVSLILTADHISSLETYCNLPDSELTNFCHWWQQRKAMRKIVTDLPKHVYETLVARFCGPATTVDVYCIKPPRLELRTQGEGVAEAGERMVKLCLYPEQVDILNRAEPRVYLSGPPGTGKTVMLYLKGMQWLIAGHDVHIVNCSKASRAAGYILEHLLQQTLQVPSANEALDHTPLTPGTVCRHDYYFENSDGDEDIAALELEKASQNKELCIIADEVEDKLDKFCTRLLLQTPKFNMWAASVYNDKIPKCLHEEKVTVALRSPPVVLQEVKRSARLGQEVYGYSTSCVPAPTDGPSIIYFPHSEAQGHTDIVEDCEECGRNIASLLHKLNIGKKSQNRTCDLFLQYNDILVLCDDPHDEQVDSCGPAVGSGLVRGLRACQIPVHVVEKDASDADIFDMALALRDEVTVTDRWNVQGLERKLVVMKVYFYFSLHFPSRSTSLLVFIK